MLARSIAAAGLSAFAVFGVAAEAYAQADALGYCKADVARLCPGVEPGGGRIIACLKAHKMEVSVGCAKALQKAKGRMGK